jgi:hypothetical protein
MLSSNKPLRRAGPPLMVGGAITGRLRPALLLPGHPGPAGGGDPAAQRQEAADVARRAQPGGGRPAARRRLEPARPADPAARLRRRAARLGRGPAAPGRYATHLLEGGEGATRQGGEKGAFGACQRGPGGGRMRRWEGRPGGSNPRSGGGGGARPPRAVRPNSAPGGVPLARGEVTGTRRRAPRGDRPSSALDLFPIRMWTS